MRRLSLRQTIVALLAAIFESIILDLHDKREKLSESFYTNSYKFIL